MLKMLVNEAHFVLEIKAEGPLLIKSGYNTISGPDMTPVLTYRNGRQEVFIPGSSLKGIFRSQLEKVVGSIKPLVACNPFLKQNADRNANESGIKRHQEALKVSLPYCGNKFRRDSPADEVYKGSCPICRLFGSTSFIGRVAIGDAYLVGDTTTAQKRVERRDGVGIDRMTGGAADKAKFDMEVVTEGTTFATTIHLRNFEIWQLGMLFVVVQDLEDELIRMGSGSARGLGQISARISTDVQGWHGGGVSTTTIRSAQGQKQEPDNQLWGLGHWLSHTNSYGTRPNDLLELASPVPHTPHGIRLVRSFTGDALTNLRGQAIEKFLQAMSEWPQAQVPAQTANAQRGQR